MAKPKTAPPTDDAQQPQAVAHPVPNAAMALANLEQVRAKAELLERRITSWESALEDIRKDIYRLQKTSAPEPGEAAALLDELSHRVARLEERREETALPPPGKVPATRRPPSTQRRASNDEAVAIVRARWEPNQGKPGDRIALTAQCDGIDPGTTVPIRICSATESTPIVEIDGQCDGDVVRAEWTVPENLPTNELIFEIAYRGWVARSPILDI